MLELVALFSLYSIPFSKSFTFNTKFSTGIVFDMHQINRYRIKLSLPGVVDDMYWDPKSAPKLDFDECYYEVLEVKHDSADTVIKKAFYKMVTKYHPDSKESEKEKALCNKQMMVINGAYRVLKDPVTRSAYDKQRRLGFKGAAAEVKGSGKNPASTARPQTRKPAPTAGSSGGETSGRRNKVWGDFDSDLYDELLQDAAREAEEEVIFQTNSARNRKSKISSGGILEEIEDFIYNNPQYYTNSGGGGDVGGSNRRTSPPYQNAADSKLTSLHATESRLRIALLEKEQLLLQDRRDWGEVKDIRLIEKRLKDLEAFNELRAQLQVIVDEIKALEWTLEWSNGKSKGPATGRPSNPFQDYDDEDSDGDPMYDNDFGIPNPDSPFFNAFVRNNNNNGGRDGLGSSSNSVFGTSFRNGGGTRYDSIGNPGFIYDLRSDTRRVRSSGNSRRQPPPELVEEEEEEEEEREEDPEVLWRQSYEKLRRNPVASQTQPQKQGTGTGTESNVKNNRARSPPSDDNQGGSGDGGREKAVGTDWEKIIGGEMERLQRQRRSSDGEDE